VIYLSWSIHYMDQLKIYWTVWRKTILNIGKLNHVFYYNTFRNNMKKSFDYHHQDSRDMSCFTKVLWFWFSFDRTIQFLMNSLRQGQREKNWILIQILRKKSWKSEQSSLFEIEIFQNWSVFPSTSQKTWIFWKIQLNLLALKNICLLFS
jgi:hypothetical protein